MSGPSYPAARAVADRIEARFAVDTTAFQNPGDAPRPDAPAIEEIISTAFWSSLRREEGKGPRISLAFVSPEQSVRPLTFEPRLPLEPNVITRLAPAVERPGIHLGVWRYDNQLFVWGTTRAVPMWCFVLEVVAPGLLVVKYRRSGPSGKFANVAVLEGADVKFIARQQTDNVEPVSALAALMAFYSSGGRHQSDNTLVRLAISIRRHGHGGTLLVVPKENDEWQKSIVQPVTYSVFPPFPGIEAATHDSLAHSSDSALDTTRLAVDALAGLTAVDGATVISDRFDLLAFGVKIQSLSGADRIRKVLLKEPIEDLQDAVLDPSQIGGTRHLSAAQFVHDQRDSIALVASQDSRFTVFAWSLNDEIVHAHRLETLLM